MTQPLNRAFNVAVNRIVGEILPQGFDVSPDAPATFEDLVSYYRETGRICVWDGASDNTIFADAQTNYAFRAWHDSKHVLYGFPFTREGEFAAMIEQCYDIRKLYGSRTISEEFCTILAAEIIGQFDYKERFGGFPTDQMGFALAYIGNARNPGLIPSPLVPPARFGISN